MNRLGFEAEGTLKKILKEHLKTHSFDDYHVRAHYQLTHLVG